MVNWIQIRLYFTWLLIMEAYLREHVKFPQEKALLIPVMQVEISDKETPGATSEELKLASKTDQDSVNSLYLKIGDKEYKYEDLLKYRMNTDIFEVNYANNGIFGVIESGPSKVAADGYYIITEPLPYCY
jgi:hypothetical protein